MAKLSIKDLDLKGQRVFIRVDFNVPLKNGVIGDDTRIKSSLPTIEYALGQGATVVLASHLGRPKGKVNPDMSLRPIADRLAQLLGKPVAFATDCIGEQASAVKGDVVLLENLRFHAEEEKNDAAFAKALASLATRYVNDAFGAAHRAHASVEGITHCFEQPAAGLLMEKELQYLGHALEKPERPFVAILGGAKVSDKIDVIQNMLGKVDRLIIGGAMAYTFFKSRGVAVGRSLVEDDKLDEARAIEADAKTRGVTLLLPTDHVVTAKLEAGSAHEVLAVGDAAIGDRMGVDIGPASIAAYTAAIADAKTVVWNGPMGVFEIDAFAAGTNAVAQAVAAVKGTTIIGGGDSIAAVKKAGIADRITHISTGGGASLEFLGGQTLPGVAALADKGNRAGRAGGAGSSLSSPSCPSCPQDQRMRTPLIAGNWKMYKTVGDAVGFVTELRDLVKGVGGVDIVVAPAFTAVHAAAGAARGTGIAIAAQDLYWEREGAFTGEVSPAMVKEAGAAYVIVGHSERRRLFGESDVIVNRKTLAAIGAGLIPIVCIGETLEERERGEMLEVLDRQIKDGLDQISAAQIGALVVAYEPVWAIGTGRTATAAQAGEAHAHIRKRLRQWFGADAADACRILYGGSVKPDNILELIAEPDVDGALVGGASLDARSFADIVTRSGRPAV